MRPIPALCAALVATTLGLAAADARAVNCYVVFDRTENVIYRDVFPPVDLSDAGKQVAALAGHTGPVRGWDVSPDERQFCTAAGGRDRTIRLWDAASQRQLKHKTSDTPVINCVFSADGRAVRFPATAPALNQTVIVLPETK